MFNILLCFFSHFHDIKNMPIIKYLQWLCIVIQWKQCYINAYHYQDNKHTLNYLNSYCSFLCMKHVAVMKHRWYTDISATVSYTHHKPQCLSESNQTLQRDTEVGTPARERTMTQDKYSNRIITSGKEMSLHISSESHGSLEGWGSNSRVSSPDYSSLWLLNRKPVCF